MKRNLELKPSFLLSERLFCRCFALKYVLSGAIANHLYIMSDKAFSFGMAFISYWGFIVGAFSLSSQVMRGQRSQTYILAVSVPLEHQIKEFVNILDQSFH